MRFLARPIVTGSLKMNALQRKARIVAEFDAAGATQDEILYAAMH